MNELAGWPGEQVSGEQSDGVEDAEDHEGTKMFV